MRRLLVAIPDGKLLDSLRSARGKGRNDDPVHVLWGVVVPDLGEQTAGDATGLSARRSRSKAGFQQEAAQGLPQTSGGRKEYFDEEGHVTKVVEWFGFKLHLLVDVKHEVVLSYLITDTKAGDGETLPALVDQAETNLPDDRLQTLADDRPGQLVHSEDCQSDFP